MSSRHTTVTEFKHPELASTVALIGNRHEGNKFYMFALRDELDTYESRGSVFHYESLSDSSDEEIATAPQGVQESYHALTDIAYNGRSAATPLGHVSLHDIMKPEMESWENHDATKLELAAHIQERFIQRVAIRSLITLPISYYLLAPSILSYRNAIALRAVDTALATEPNRDITLLWGQAHVPGLTRGLVIRGFRRAHRTLHYPSGIESILA
jgi:hypothetical protein